VLRRYEQAYEALNVAAVLQVYPGLARNQNDLRDSFAGMSTYEIDIRSPRVSVQNATASVRALVARHLLPKVGRRTDSEVPSEFQLRREGDTWVIVAVSGVKPNP
jgi:hypothetical protein